MCDCPAAPAKSDDEWRGEPNALTTFGTLYNTKTKLSKSDDSKLR